jgi:hypothetical protein
MGGLDVVRNILQKGDWLAKLDLEDMYLTFLVCNVHHAFSLERGQILVQVSYLVDSATGFYKAFETGYGCHSFNMGEGSNIPGRHIVP